jgi:hypothetical protein
VAYLNFLVAAPEADVQALRWDASITLNPSLVVAMSHLVGYWVEVQPLGKLLGQAIDGGLPVNSELWHPLRPPVFHGADAVEALQAQLADAWQHVLASLPLPEDEWYRVEIEKVLRLFQHAAARHEAVVSVLERPGDAERGRRVRIPFEWK